MKVKLAEIGVENFLEMFLFRRYVQLRDMTHQNSTIHQLRAQVKSRNVTSLGFNRKTYADDEGNIKCGTLFQQSREMNHLLRLNFGWRRMDSEFQQPPHVGSTSLPLPFEFRRVELAETQLYEAIDEYFECTLHFNDGLEDATFFNEKPCRQRIIENLKKRFPENLDEEHSSLINHVRRSLQTEGEDKQEEQHDLRCILAAKADNEEIVVREPGHSDVLAIHILIRKPVPMSQKAMLEKIEGTMSKIITLSRVGKRYPTKAVNVQIIEGKKVVASYDNVEKLEPPASRAWQEIPIREKVTLAFTITLILILIGIGKGDSTSKTDFLSNLRNYVFSSPALIISVILAIIIVLAIFYKEYIKARSASPFKLVEKR